MRLLNRPWTIAALGGLYLARPALLDINTLAVGVRVAPDATYILIGFTAFSILVAIGLWFRSRPVWLWRSSSTGSCCWPPPPRS